MNLKCSGELLPRAKKVIVGKMWWRWWRWGQLLLFGICEHGGEIVYGISLVCHGGGLCGDVSEEGGGQLDEGLDIGGGGSVFGSGVFLGGMTKCLAKCLTMLCHEILSSKMMWIVCLDQLFDETPDLVVLEVLSWSMFLLLWAEFRGKIKNLLRQVPDHLENNGIPNGVSSMPNDKTSSAQDACLGGPFNKDVDVYVDGRAIDVALGSSDVILGKSVFVLEHDDTKYPLDEKLEKEKKKGNKCGKSFAPRILVFEELSLISEFAEVFVFNS
nr:hypothetical protein [Tanacetum cinerariifolium]